MIHKKIAICEWSMRESGKEAISAAGRYGFNGIQILEGGAVGDVFPLLKTEVQKDYMLACEESGIKIQALHLWSLCRTSNMLHSPATPAGAAADEWIKKALEACADMHIPALMLTAGVMATPQAKRAEDAFMEHLLKACELGKDCGVKITFETAASAETAAGMVDAIAGRAKLCYDFFNPIRFNTGDPLSDIKKIGLERIDHFHVKDGPAGMIGCTLLGEGVGRYREVISYIDSEGYDGWFVTENYYAQPLISERAAYAEAIGLDAHTMRGEL